MKHNKIIALLGLSGFIMMFYGGFILFEPSSGPGTFFGLIGSVFAFFPIYYLFRTDEVEN